MASDQTQAANQPKRKPPIIHPNAVFSLDMARSTLALAKNWLPREIRLGRLRVAKENPARSLYERLGFAVTAEDERKYEMTARPTEPAP